MDDITVAWLAGLLEGEGSFVCPPPSSPNQPRISIQMTDLDVMERVSKIFGAKCHPTKLHQEHHKQAWICQVRGSHAVELMGQLYPHMGIRRQKQIEKALALYVVKQVHPIPDTQINHIKDGLVCGKSRRQIARELGVAHRTVNKYAKIMGMQTVRG